MVKEVNETKDSKKIKVYGIKKSCFTFNGVESYDLDIMGKSTVELLRDSFTDIEFITEKQFKKNEFERADINVFLYTTYPLFDTSCLNELLASIKKMQYEAISCSAGYILCGSTTYKDAKKTSFECGVSFSTLNDYPLIKKLAQQKVLKAFMDKGVMIECVDSVYIDSSVEIEEGVKIMPNNIITGNSIIHSGAVIECNSNIHNCVIGKNTKVTASVLKDSQVGDNTNVGPNAYLRPNSVIGSNCKVGDFVEIKNSSLGDGTKVSHLAYVGDVNIGENVNIGCGVIFVNYDGKTKHRSVVGDNCFIGSNSNIVAPVNIQDNVFVAAGTTVTGDLEKFDMCIGRAVPVVKKERAKKYLKG